MRVSAGLVMYRWASEHPEVLLVHPGGPFWRTKDLGAWSIPKGEAGVGEELLDVARREFLEETGHQPTGPFLELGSIRQKAGKLVHAWAFEGDWDPRNLRSNEVVLEWPPRSGKTQRFPEVDRAEFFGLGEAKQKINAAQAELLDRLAQRLNRG